MYHRHLACFFQFLKSKILARPVKFFFTQSQGYLVVISTQSQGYFPNISTQSQGYFIALTWLIHSIIHNLYNFQLLPNFHKCIHCFINIFF